MTSTLPQPALRPAPDWAFPTPHSHTLSNGMKVLVHDLPGQYVVSASLVLDLPLNNEERHLEGVATLCCRTLDEGTQTHPGEEFAELLETEGAAFGLDLGLSGVIALLDVPASRLPRALPLFAEALREPALADADVERHRVLRLAEIEQVRANSAQTASIAFRAAVFEPGSRAARMTGGEPETLGQVGVEDVRGFHRDWFGPRGATLVLGGDFTGLDPIRLAEEAFGDWTNPDQRIAGYASPEPAERPTSRIVHRAGAVQADLRLGGFGIDRTDPRWPDTLVASYAMGGAFLSRLNSVLREEKGYTYGVGMLFGPLRRGGSYAVQGSFRTEVLVDALAEARELLDVTERPFTAAEVADAVQFQVGVAPLRYGTADGVVDQTGSQLLAGLPRDYVDTNLAALRAVTPESATAAYHELVDLGAMSLVVAGDADVLAEPLRGLGFRDLVIDEG
ncbi:MAG: M16 family metallopeptidase [Propionibacteriaceae bacterium]